MISQCIICKKEFKHKPSHKRKYCSRNCFKKAMIGRKGYWRGKKRPEVKNFQGFGFKKGNTPWNKGHFKEKHNLWKGGSFINEEGYKMAYIGNGNYYPKHRLVMEQHLKRKLKRNELVHHINDNKQDNRIENLKVMSWSEHTKYHQHKGDLNKK